MTSLSSPRTVFKPARSSGVQAAVLGFDHQVQDRLGKAGRSRLRFLLRLRLFLDFILVGLIGLDHGPGQRFSGDVAAVCLFCRDAEE